MPSHVERTLVRLLIGTALCTALLVFALVPIPKDSAGSPVLPAIALSQAGLYRLEMALLVFYGVLLVATPTFSGLVRGRLPIEITTRGAKFSEDADQSAGLAESATRELERSVSVLAEELEEVGIELHRMRSEVTVRDRD